MRLSFLLNFYTIFKVFRSNVDIKVIKVKYRYDMDVSRINAVSSMQVDWRKLTAKEIIEYDEQGVDVPTQYLQWAQEFRQSIDSGDSDDTTYEMATSTDMQSSDSVQIPVESNASSETSTEGEPDVAQEEQKTAAQSKREDLQNAGVSLRDQAKIFTADSKSATSAVLESASIITEAQDSSISEIQSLENEMATLLARAESVQNELKSEVDKINNNENNASAFGKINKLQQQLEQYGNTGQSAIADSEADFNIYESTINGQSEIILNAQDFGTETIGVGNDLLTSIKGADIFRIRDYVIGRRAVNTGEDAVSNSETVAALQTQALDTNSSNLAQIPGYQNNVENKTGVGAISYSQKSDNGETDQNGDKKSGADKSVQTAQNDGTDTNAKASTNLDEILKAKIRKGENINEQSA